MWERLDDALKPFRLSPRGTRMLGHAGPPTAKARRSEQAERHSFTSAGLLPALVAL
jgi:hypothetical protein